MSTLTVDHLSTTTVPLPNGPKSVREQIWGLLANLYPVAPLMNRRTEQRYPFACLAHVAPVGDDGKPVGKPIVAATKNISEGGISFFHPANLPYRRVVLTFERDDVAPVSFLVDVNWCRFTRHGWYESGGRLMQVVEAPRIEEPAAAGKRASC
jgi:hypothetical protein